MRYKSYKVLHLEDEKLFTELIRSLFEDINVEYESCAENNKISECLETGNLDLLTQLVMLDLREKQPDLFIVDLQLFDDSDPSPGISLIQEVFQEYKKIMVLSARSDEYIQEDLKGYILHYAVKAFRPSAFKKKILEILNAQSNQ
ncbi:putative Signal transduction response regulator, receiver region domain protein [Candidatus Magnetomoraceae bacterium gMMP-15]